MGAEVLVQLVLVDNRATSDVDEGRIGPISENSRPEIRPRVPREGIEMTKMSAAASTESSSSSDATRSTGSCVSPDRLTAWIRAPSI